MSTTETSFSPYHPAPGSVCPESFAVHRYERRLSGPIYGMLWALAFEVAGAGVLAAVFVLARQLSR